ncbi:MAG: PIN domain-containing protein, partial [Lachnospiraceae bacterium]|nr:PIN domain-containing protein [Lachnospiraceae bacterium]
MFGRKNGCRYFIDSENVNEVWVNILNILKPEDHIFLFYTDNSAHISCARAVELINIGAKRITGIRCKEGNNGLDFQMVTQLGAVISKSPKCEYILISNDNGFDAVVSYWKQKGYNIRREKSSFCVSLQISDPEKPSAAQKKNSNTNRRQNSGQRYQNRPRLENKKDYKKQTPKLEDKTQQPAGGKTYQNKPYENKSYDNKTYENKAYESKAADGKAGGSKSTEGKLAAGKAADNSKGADEKASKDRASDNKKVVDLEAKKARKLEEKKRREKAREAEAEKKNKAVLAEEET